MHTTITIKTEKKLRDKAKRTAKKLGIPLTTAMNAMLRQFVRDRSITVSLEPKIRPEKLAEWNKIGEEMDRGEGITGKFTKITGLTAHMNRVWREEDSGKKVGRA